MKKVRSILILLLAALMLTVFVGCNPNSGLDDGSGDTTPVVDYKKFESFKTEIWDNLPTKPGKGEPINYTELTADEQAAFIADANEAGFTVEWKTVIGGGSGKEEVRFFVTCGTKVLEQHAYGGWYVNDFDFALLDQKISAVENDDFGSLPGYPRYQYMPESYKADFMAAVDAHDPKWVADFSKGDLVLTIDRDIVLTQGKGAWYAEDYTYLNKINKYAETKNTEDLGADVYAKMTELEFNTVKNHLPEGLSAPVIDETASTFTIRISDDKILVQDADGVWTEKVSVITSVEENLLITKVIITGNDKIIAVKNISEKTLDMEHYSYLENNKKSNNRVVAFPTGKLGSGKTLYLYYDGGSYKTDKAKFTKTFAETTVELNNNADETKDVMLAMGKDPYYWALCTSKAGDTAIAIIEGDNSNRIVDEYKNGEEYQIKKNYVYYREYDAETNTRSWKLSDAIPTAADAEEAKQTFRVAFDDYVYEGK